MGGIGAFRQTFHGGWVILKILELNGKTVLIRLITLPDRASLILPKRVHRTPRTRIKDMPTRKPNAEAARDAELLEIARRQFRIETLETRNWDRLDFHDVAVWAIRAALEDAFEAGRRAGPANIQP
jgi:hypothetical protein